MVSSTPFGNGFWTEVLKQCHMPLYYLYLKPFAWASDTILRFTSVIPSVLSIYVMYLVGKEYSPKTGYLCSGITAILPFLVYYSQEVRFYSLLFLFAALSLLYTIRLVRGKAAIVGYIISNILILLTHVLGCIYVFFNLSLVIYKKKYYSKKLIFIFASVLLLIIPFGLNVLQMLPSSQWWGNFSYTNILFFFSDCFSPILTNNVNAPSVFLYNKAPLFLFLLIVPTVIAAGGVILGAKKEKGLAFIALGVILIMSLLAITSSIVFITKYSIEILPILILLIVLAYEKVWGNILLGCFITINLLSIFTPYYPSLKLRSEGHNLVCNILNKQNPDKIIFTYYSSDRFQRYLKVNAKEYSIDKNQRFEFLKNPTMIFRNINSGDKVSVVFLESVSFIPDEYIEKATEQNIPEMFITFSEIKNSLIKCLNDEFTDFQVSRSGDWLVITATCK
jgi:uncharacterized membrane protein